MEKALTKKPAVTIAQMIKLKKNNPILFRTEFNEYLKPKETVKTWAVMILTGTVLRIIPTTSLKVIKVFIEWSQTGSDMLNKGQELGVVYGRNNIKTLYSSAICFCGHIPPHPYDGYIDSTNLPISEDQLKSELLVMPSIDNVEITKVDVGPTQ